MLDIQFKIKWMQVYNQEQPIIQITNMNIKYKHPPVIYPQTRSSYQQNGIMGRGTNFHNKVYIPINQPINNSANNSKIHRQQANNQLISQLKRINSELKQKQELYIDKLIKLQEGLQRQHEEFMQLQDLYNQLFKTYKQKQQQISELEMMFRQSQRKKHYNNQSVSQQRGIQVQNDENISLKNILQQNQNRSAELELKVKDYQKRIAQLQKYSKSLNVQVNYHKSKQKINDSRTSLSSKVFQELEQWQKAADYEKEQRIKTQYENQFLRTRNNDLQTKIEYIQAILSQKQMEITKMRQQKIDLHRQNSEARLSRSRSKSPTHHDGSASPNKENLIRINSVVGQLHRQNQNLKEQISALKQQLTHKCTISSRHNSMSPQYQNNQSDNQRGSSEKQQSRKYVTVRQQQFFSFSRDDIQPISSINQHASDRMASEQSINDENKQGQASVQQNRDEQLEQLPASLQIDDIIKRSGQKQRREQSGYKAEAVSINMQENEHSSKIPEFECD